MRAKHENIYTRVMKVKKKISDRAYVITNGSIDYSVSLNDMKKYHLPYTDGWSIHDGDFSDILSSLEVNRHDLVSADTFEEIVAMSWVGKCVFSGVYLRRVEILIEKLIKDRPTYCVMVVPELPCEVWYRKIRNSHISQRHGHVSR